MKPKNILLIAFMAFLTIGLKAQEKYDYGVVSYGSPGGGWSKYVVYSSLSDTYKQVEDGKLNNGNIFLNFEPVNKYLADLSVQGWEVYNTQTDAIGGSWYFRFYVRKKKN